MMQDLRAKTKIVMVVVALAFVGLMVFDWGMDITGQSSNLGNGVIGEVNGEPITFNAYTAVYQQMYAQAQQEAGGELSAEQVKQLEDAAFEQVVGEILLRQEIERRGIRVTDRDIQEAARWNPHPQLAQQEIFLTNGQFDIGKWQQFLNGPQASDEMLLQLEQYYRGVIPQQKLLRQVTAGSYLSDAELWRLWQDQNETVTVDYLALDVAKLVPGDMQVTESEIEEYYESHESEFDRPATVRLSFAIIDKGAAAADRGAARARAATIRAEIAGGADFAAVAARESADPGSRATGGDLGMLTRGQTVPPFEAALESLPIGQISEPVETDFGFHIIQVQGRSTAGFQARHILIAPEPNDSVLDLLYTRGDSLETLAESVGLARAARATRAIVRQGVTITEAQPFVPGIGSAFEAVDWALEEYAAEDGATISPLLETETALFVAERELVTEAGIQPLAQATPEIRRLLIQQKKRAEARKIGEQMLAAVRGGKTLEQVAQERGMSVASAGPFTRLDANPVFGQATAAVGAAFGTPVGRISGVVETPAGLFIVRPTARVQANRAEFDSQKQQIRQVAVSQLQQQLAAQFVQDLRERAEVDDRRDEVLRASNAQTPLPPL